MDSRRRFRVALGERLVRRLGPELVVRALPPLPRAGSRGRRKVELDERCPQIQARATHDNRSHLVLERAIDRRVRQVRVLADRCLVVEAPDPDQLGRVLGLVRQDRDASVDLHRVGGDQTGRDPLGKCLGDRALARRGRAEDRDYLSHADGRGRARGPRPSRRPPADIP
jgi:hypothetical protein